METKISALKITSFIIILISFISQTKAINLDFLATILSFLFLLIFNKKIVKQFVKIALVIFIIGFFLDIASTILVYKTIGPSFFDKNSFIHEYNPLISKAMEKYGWFGTLYYDGMIQSYSNFYINYLLFGLVFLDHGVLNMLATPLFFIGSLKIIQSIANVMSIIS